MDYSLWRLWWLIFPVMWFVFGILRMLNSHRHQRETLQLLRTYAEQGKEPPAEVIKVLQSGSLPDGRRWSGCRGPWHRVVVLGSLALGFGVMAYLERDVPMGHRLLFPTVILGALALGYLLIALLQPKSNEQ